MKKSIEKIIYVILGVLSAFLGVKLLLNGFPISGLIFLFIAPFTIAYSFYVNFRNKKSLPSLLLFYILLGFFLFSGVDTWVQHSNNLSDNSSTVIKHFIPKEGHHLYPENGFKELGLFEDVSYSLHNENKLKLDEQKELKFKEDTFKIYKGFQGGIYSYAAWLNIPQDGEIYLKAYDSNSNFELSASRLREASTIKVSNTGGNVELFSQLSTINGESDSRSNFVIYEGGGWGNYYGARFELWYEGKGLIKKLLEDHYIIDGWQR